MIHEHFLISHLISEKDAESRASELRGVGYCVEPAYDVTSDPTRPPCGAEYAWSFDQEGKPYLTFYELGALYCISLHALLD